MKKVNKYHQKHKERSKKKYMKDEEEKDNMLVRDVEISLKEEKEKNHQYGRYKNLLEDEKQKSVEYMKN